MRLPLALALLGASASTLAVEQQVPLKEKAAGWLDKAKSYIPSAVPNPVEAGAAAVAAVKVEEINTQNYVSKLQPKVGGEEEWMVYLTGGNKSCFGRCGNADRSWNESVALISALTKPAGSPPLHLAQLDCEENFVLCAGWASSIPSLYHFIFPQRSADPTAPAPKSELRIVELSVNVTTSQLVALARAAPDSVIMQDFEPYEGAWHPVDGWLAKLGLQYYLGYVIWLTGTTPSWAIMIFISFLSRQYMGRRAARGRPGIVGQTGGAAPASPQPAAVPAAAGRGTPGSAGKGGKKRK